MSGRPRLTEIRSIGSYPMAACAVGPRSLSGATEGVAGVCGAYESHLRVWRPGGGLGFRLSNCVHPMLKNWRCNVCRPETWGAPGRCRVSPPPCGRARPSRRRGFRVTSAGGTVDAAPSSRWRRQGLHIWAPGVPGSRSRAGHVEAFGGEVMVVEAPERSKRLRRGRYRVPSSPGAI